MAICDMHRRLRGRSGTSDTTSRAAGDVTDAGKSRSAVSHGRATNSTNAASPSRNVTSAALRIEALHEQADRSQLEGYAERKHEPREDRCHAARESPRDQ